MKAGMNNGIETAGAGDKPALGDRNML